MRTKIISVYYTRTGGIFTAWIDGVVVHELRSIPQDEAWELIHNLAEPHTRLTLTTFP